MSNPKPVRVMHFIHSLKSGGAERLLVYLINHSDPTKFTHAVCCFNDTGKEELISGCVVFKLNRKSKYDFKSREIYKLLSSWKPEIVHNWLPNVQVNSFIPHRWNRNSLYIDSNHNNYRFDRPYRIFQALVYLLSDELISVTPPDKLYFPFKQIFKFKGGIFIPNGIPVGRISSAEPVLPATVRSDPGDTLVLFVGRLSPEKNVSLLLQSVNKLSQEHRGLRLVICGEGHAKDQLRKQALELKIDNRVYFLGYQENIYSIMKACDLLVLPSFREGMPLVLFEALAAGLSVIASQIPSHEYWFENQEIVSLFDPHSLDDLSECIKRELRRSDDDRYKRREKASRLVNGLDIDVMVRRYTDFYESLLQ